MIALILFFWSAVVFRRAWRTATYAVNVAGSSLPLGIAITTIRDFCKGVRDIRVQARILAKIELVAVPVRVGAARVTSLSAAGDGDSAATSILQGNSTSNSRSVDLVIRSASSSVAVCAAAGRDRGNASGL